MKNNFINGYRKRKVQPQHVELDELRDSGKEHAGIQAAFAEDELEAGSLAEEMDGDLARAINAIPHDYKMALLLVPMIETTNCFPSPSNRTSSALLISPPMIQWTCQPLHQMACSSAWGELPPACCIRNRSSQAGGCT